MISQSIKLKSEPQSINAVEGIIDELKDEFSFSDDCYGNILVAVTEAVNNAIYHGNQSDPSKEVHLNYEFKQEKISFSVSDQGTGFDIYNLPDPTLPENLEKPNGRGIFLMKQLADQLIFSDSGRVVELYFNLA